LNRYGTYLVIVLGITTRALVQGRCGFGLETKIKDKWSLVTRIVMTYNQCSGSGSGFNQVCGSGSSRAKFTHKSRKNLEISCFEVLDILFWELKASSVTSTSFMEA
jgi:hypothetical protein